MRKNIDKQLQIIEKANQWIKNSLEGNKEKVAHRNFANLRRELNKKKYALEGNPAAAIYGESQVGKSYLISSLLSELGNPFSISDVNRNKYNFIEEINPPGGGSESTSLVTRFSVNYKPKNQLFPIKATLLSISDLVLVLCDSFYNDINLKGSHFLSAEDINSEITKIKNSLSNKTTRQSIVTEDHILDIKDYFSEYFQKADRIIDSKFFEDIPILISKSQPHEWEIIFSLLWNKNEIFTKLFAQLVNEYQKLKFEQIVFLPIESVLYTYGTLLDVNRLKEIYNNPDRIESKYTPDTKVLLSNTEQEINFTKSYLCALTAELVFSQPDSLLGSKPFLEETDLLDFPGARSRMEIPLSSLVEETMPELLLRGKVAYLFNKYSDSEKINILLFCAKHEQTAQRMMPRLLNNWATKIVGKDTDARETFIKKSHISPLFIIGTFFNINLQYNSILDKPGNKSSLDYRWEQRFTRTLSEYLEHDRYSWFKKWTKSQLSFQNIYLLRDFEKSETPSNIFRGYNKNKREVEEIINEMFPEFRTQLRQSFIEHEFVKQHFANPEESWDEAATINKDGTELIIKNLTIAADNINEARKDKIVEELKDINASILSELLKHFHSNDKDEELQKAKEIAADIQLNLVHAFSADKIKNFGQLMKELMLDEGEVLVQFRKKIDDIGHREILNLDKYSTYRIEVPVEKGDTAESYFERLCIKYEKTTDKRKEEFRVQLEQKKINLDELICGNSDLIKNNAQQLAETILEYWLEQIESEEKEFVKRILGQDSSLDNLKEMYQKLFKKYGLANHISKKIRKYVDGYGKVDLPYEIVADTAVEVLNRFISTVGFDYLDDSEINDLKEANSNNDLGLILDNNIDSTEDTIEELFTKIGNQTQIMAERPEELNFLPNYRNYQAWSNRLKIGFVTVCDIPNYDITANAKLGEIIDSSKTVKY